MKRLADVGYLFLYALMLALPLAGCAAKRGPAANVTYEVVEGCWANHRLVCRNEHFRGCKFVPPLPAECQSVVINPKGE